MMHDFNICIATKFIFGKNAELNVGNELNKMGIKKVLIHHDNGKFLYDAKILETVKENLKSKEIESIELGGVLPNPRLSLVREGIKLVKEENVEMILAIGGGSVIDSAKAIGLGAMSDVDVWEFFIGKAKPNKSLPIGTILTCPATGSESSDVTVINNIDSGEKLLVSDPVIRPTIAFMNPKLTYSIPQFVTSCGIIDMFSHVCERYFTSDDEIGVIDRMSEGILKTLIEIGPKLLENPTNYKYRAEIMWIGTIAHNDTVGIGRIQDWATHELGNELSAMYDVPHGATLSVIMPSWMKHVYKQKQKRFARYANKVFGVKLDEENILDVAHEGILRTEEYFKRMGMPVSFNDLKVPTDEIEKILDKIKFRGVDQSIGGIVRLNRADCFRIYETASL